MDSLDQKPNKTRVQASDAAAAHLPPPGRLQGARKPSQVAGGERPEPYRGVASKRGYVIGFDGTRLFYSTEGQGPPLVFCYGLVCSSLHWTYQIEHFRHQYQTIWFDYRGHQNSEVPKNLASLTLENFAKDLKAVLDELEVEQAIFLGHSMGVNVVLDFLKHHPQRVQAMVLANGTSHRPLETIFHHNALQGAFTLLKRIYRQSPFVIDFVMRSQKLNPIARSLVAMGGFNPHLTPQADIDHYVDQVLAMDPAILMQLIESYEAYDGSAWLNKIECPTLILAGEKDRVIPLEQQQLMHQLIAGSQLEVISHGSHCPQMDLPDMVNQKIEEFLQSLSAAR